MVVGTWKTIFNGKKVRQPSYTILIFRISMRNVKFLISLFWQIPTFHCSLLHVAQNYGKVIHLFDFFCDSILVRIWSGFFSESCLVAEMNSRSTFVIWNGWSNYISVLCVCCIRYFVLGNDETRREFPVKLFSLCDARATAPASPLPPHQHPDFTNTFLYRESFD